LGDDARVAQNGQVFRNLSLSSFARLLRGRGSGKGELAFTDQDQITNVNHRVREVSENADRIASENEVKTHDHASGDAPIPKRHRDNTFALPLGGEPLDEETH